MCAAFMKTLVVIDSVHEYAAIPRRARNALMASRSSVMWMALTSTPAVRGLLVKVGGSVSVEAVVFVFVVAGLKSEVNESETASEPSRTVGLLPFAGSA